MRSFVRFFLFFFLVEDIIVLQDVFVIREEVYYSQSREREREIERDCMNVENAVTRDRCFEYTG